MPDNYHLIEGPYKNFTIRRVRPQDEDKVLQHIKDHFLHDEPISKLCGYSEEYAEEFIYVIRYFLRHNMTFWMEHNETGEVAAVRAICIEKEGYDAWKFFPRKSRASHIFYTIGNDLHDMVDLYKKYDVPEVADLVVSSCAPKYRKQGLSKILYQRSMDFLAAEGVKLVKSVFTSPYSRSAVAHLGFEEVCRLYYKDVKDENGNPAFDNSKLDEEHYGALMAKRL